jgi:hypothetical protein
MKKDELRKATKCAVCQKPFGWTGIPSFWRISIERHHVNMNAIQRQDGLAMMLGSSKLASVMGTDEEMTKPLMDRVEVTICEMCAMSPVLIPWLAELGNGG